MKLHTLSCLPANTGVATDTYIVGDLHAGDGSPTDDFARNADLFAQFLASVGTVYTCGDALELWQARELDVYRAYGDVLACLDAGKGVRGNHDLNRKDKMPDVMRVGNCKIVHGHQADPWCSRWRTLGWLITVALAGLERLGWGDADNPEGWWLRFVKTPAEMNKETYGQLAMRYYHYCGTLLDAETEVVVFGHTHRAALIRNGNKVIANVGTWASFVYPCTCVRLTPSDVALIQVDN